ncbi:MAG: hypothetical protein JWR18_1094, partial [Segetibacter sp.]|nr:hypothetical protein [Segetibacter sp.]
IKNNDTQIYNYFSITKIFKEKMKNNLRREFIIKKHRLF